MFQLCIKAELVLAGSLSRPIKDGDQTAAACGRHGPTLSLYWTFVDVTKRNGSALYR